MADTPKAKSFADILQQNQEFIAHLQALQDDAGAQLAEKAKELGLVKRELEAKQQELDELQNAQLQWAMDRQALLTQHDALKQGHVDLQQAHDRGQVELGRLKDDVTRAKTRDEERRSQLRQLEQERMQLAQKYEADQKKIRADLKTAQDDLNELQSSQLQWAVDRETLLKDRDTAVARQAQLEQEWQKARAELTQDKARLTDLTAQLPEKKPRYETKKDHDPDGIGKFYLGREIAYVMGHQGAGWTKPRPSFSASATSARRCSPRSRRWRRTGRVGRRPSPRKSPLSRSRHRMRLPGWRSFNRITRSSRPCMPISRGRPAARRRSGPSANSGSPRKKTSSRSTWSGSRPSSPK